MGYKRLIALCVGICTFIFADNLHIIGTFDFNNNGKNEFLKINGLNAPLELIEVNGSEGHQTIWSYSPEGDGEIVDAKFADLNKDKVLELIVIQKNSGTDNWIQIFEWNGVDFTLNGNPFSNGDGDNDKVRPSNLSYNNGVFSAAISSPTRSTKSFGAMIEDGEYTVTNSEILSDPIVTNGYGPVFTGIFENDQGPLIALLSPESNVLKVGVFSLDTGSSLSDVFSLNGARVVLGPDLQTFDENKDGYSELIVPFATGEVFTLSAFGDSLVLM